MKFVTIAMLFAAVRADGEEEEEEEVEWSNPLRTYDGGPWLELAAKTGKHGASGYSGKVMNLTTDNWFGILWNKDQQQKQDYWYFKAKNEDNCKQIDDKYSEKSEKQWKDNNGDDGNFDEQKATRSPGGDGVDNKDRWCDMTFDRKLSTGDDRDMTITCNVESIPTISGQWWVGDNDSNDSDNLPKTGNFTLAIEPQCTKMTFAGAYALAASAMTAASVALYM